ncbi:hypothetical protein KHA94_13595 [Bacillus sp. FJAT-49705]|uniref:Helix-turn-helix domain-containing protein n=1 Tax=Cytobacillus citreus TaxID=2833586 RepID=A0ABS5NTQ3_9BACI|nr:hypothetical protein [Cytobacillus citreus]MBS4191217.1 hypothetical protein [Cytobacillus citreus]
MQSGDINQYKQLSQFKDLNDFNNQFEQHMIDLKDKFTKSELIALKRLVRFSASIAGVCYAKIGTLVATTHQNGIGISRSTFKRMLTKAKEVGLLVVHNTFKNGKQGHSVYVFNRYTSGVEQSHSRNLEVENSPISKQTEPPKEEKLNQHNKTINLSKSSNIKNNNTIRTESVESSNQSTEQFTNLLPNGIDKEFARVSNFYFHNSSDIIELYRIATIHGRIAKLPSKTISDVAVEALKTLVYKIKQGKVKSLRGYYNGVCKKLFKREQLNNLFLSVFDV